jgi:hypothetical protein
MSSLLEEPAVQAGIAPLLAALLIGGALSRTRLAWLALAAALATAFALGTGITFTPLTASRKAMLLVLAAPWIGLALDRLPRPVHTAWPAAACALGSVWVLWSVLAQREAGPMAAMALGVALFVGVLVALLLRLRDDGEAGGAATVALGASVGVAALLSASIGNFANGIALAAGGGAMLLLQFGFGRPLAPGSLGMLTVGAAAALFAAVTFALAQLPWYALPLILLPPLAVTLLPVRDRSPRARIVTLTLIGLAAGAAPVLAAWLAARSGAA